MSAKEKESVSAKKAELARQEAKMYAIEPEEIARATIQSHQADYRAAVKKVDSASNVEEAKKSAKEALLLAREAYKTAKKTFNDLSPKEKKSAKDKWNAEQRKWDIRQRHAAMRLEKITKWGAEPRPDVVGIGAGPVGLWQAIQLKTKNPNVDILFIGKI